MWYATIDSLSLKLSFKLGKYEPQNKTYQKLERVVS